MKWLKQLHKKKERNKSGFGSFEPEYVKSNGFNDTFAQINPTSMKNGIARIMEYTFELLLI
jgi:hypothetical protein